MKCHNGLRMFLAFFLQLLNHFGRSSCNCSTITSLYSFNSFNWSADFRHSIGPMDKALSVTLFPALSRHTGTGITSAYTIDTLSLLATRKYPLLLVRIQPVENAPTQDMNKFLLLFGKHLFRHSDILLICSASSVGPENFRSLRRNLSRLTLIGCP